MRVSLRLLLALVAISITGAHTSAQMDMPAIGSAGALVKNGGSCVRLAAQMKVEGMKLRLQAGKPQTFYFHGAQIYTFPEPIKLSISASANCTDYPLFPSFAWPEFAEHLHFSFAWSTGVETNQSRLVAAKPTQKDATSPLWREGSSSKEFWFRIPAKEIPTGSRLNIDVYSGEKRLQSFSVQLGRSLQS